MRTERAFSLIEVALSLGVVAFAFMAILGLIPVGLAASRSSIDYTRGSLMARDAINRVRPILTGSTATSPQAWYYDREARYLDQTGTNSATLYRASVAWGPLQAYPANVSAAQLSAGVVSIGWPVNTTTGSAVGNPARLTYPFYLRSNFP